MNTFNKKDNSTTAVQIKLDKFRNNYRKESLRVKWWDYGNNGAYYVIICLSHQRCDFGEIIKPTDLTEMSVNKKSINTNSLAFLSASKSGELAKKYWDEIPNKFDYAELGPFVVMPDFIHGIVMINKTESQKSQIPETTLKGGFAGTKNPMLNENLSRIIRWYKGRCSFEIRKINPTFKWQNRFYDRIIRNENEYTRFSNYIFNNPKKWAGNKNLKMIINQIIKSPE
jgi:REP element-mobilizing transposase RayT